MNSVRIFDPDVHFLGASSIARHYYWHSICSSDSNNIATFAILSVKNVGLSKVYTAMFLILSKGEKVPIVRLSNR